MEGVRDLSETDLEHIKKLKGARTLESKYPLSNDQLRECGICSSKPQDYDEKEEEGENDPEIMSSRVQGDPPLFNAQGVLEDIIPDELASIHGIEEEEIEWKRIHALDKCQLGDVFHAKKEKLESTCQIYQNF
ncbi:hypothetical protein RJ639_036144 [Escallonia herrerae]|uniref:Uncharacterized protein n=1 Tax=Escallonia herrerae TaxID=1293975 RepID=A0AA88WSC7_9ASTE|nr:hypothetical protein RJ639_036144 [Escallonia herrerae]